MADVGSSVGVAKAIGDPLATLGALLNAVTPEGSVQTALFLVLGLCVAAARLPVLYRSSWPGRAAGRIARAQGL
jgi:hypothetical protein